ncbi:MAG TPA: RDD family protein [Rhabdochlamydiaceae bacterium]|nr:RDD family protein [Rhabdochlamydiaceae bacterium]
MNNNEKKPLFYQLFAGLLDYSLFFLFGSCFSLVFLYAPDIYFNLFFPLAIPLLWAPIEAFLLATTGTTPGKMFFGLSILNEDGSRLSWRQALKRAFLIGKRPGKVFRSTLRLRRKIFGVVLILGSIFGGMFGIAIKNFNGLNDPFGHLPGWIDSSTANERFTIDFPKDPELQTKQLDVPKAGQTIDYQEYSVDAKDLNYSVSYVDFPGKWRLLGSNTLLKKSLELFVAHNKEPQELVSFDFTKHKQHPAIDFVIKKEDQDIHGRIVLVGTTLYKLAVAYPSDIEEKLHHGPFLDSFEAKFGVPVYVEE